MGKFGKSGINRPGGGLCDGNYGVATIISLMSLTGRGREKKIGGRLRLIDASLFTISGYINTAGTIFI